MSKEQGRNNDDDIWEIIKEKVNEIQYGSVTITIHNGKIVQVDQNAKIRFE